MPSNNVEILFKFRTQGVEELDRVAASIDNVIASSQKTGTHLKELEHALGTSSRAAQTSGRSFAGLGDQVKNNLGAPLQSATTTISRLAANLGPVGIGVAAVGATLGVVGKQAYDLVSQFGAAAEQSVNFADRLGITIGQAERLGAAAGIAGVNIGSLEGASRLLAAALEDQSGMGAKTASGLRALGIRTVSLSGQQRELGQVLMDVLDKLAAIENDAERVFTAQRVLPRAAAQELLPLIKNYDDLTRAVARLGVGIDEGITRRLADADDEIGKMKLAWEQLKKSLASKIAPVVVEFLPTVGTGKNVLTVEDLNRMGLRVPERFRPKSEAETFTAAARAGFYTPDRIAREDARNMQRLVEYVDQQNDEAAGLTAVGVFRRERANTAEGKRRELLRVMQELAQLESVLSSEGIGGRAFTEKKKEFDALDATRKKLEADIAASRAPSGDPARLLSDLLSKYNQAGQMESERFSTELERAALDLTKAGATPRDIARLRQAASGRQAELTMQDLSRLQNYLRGRTGAEAIIGSAPDYSGVYIAPPADDKARQERDKAFTDALLAKLKLQDDIRQRTATAEIDAAIRLLELADNEYEAAVRIRDIKLATAKDAAEARQAELDYAVRIEEIEKRRTQQYKDTAGWVWDSLKAGGGGGLRDMFTGQLDILQRQIFANASAGIFQRAGGFLGQIGAASGLGGLLQGTIFDPQNAQKPLDQNTKSLDRLRTSVDKLTVRMSGGAVSGIPSLSGIDAAGLIIDEAGGFGGGQKGGMLDRLLGPVFGGGTSGKSGGSFFGGAGSLFSSGLFAGARGGDFSIALGDGRATTASALGTSWRIGNIAASGALLGLGAWGVASGIREGGASGTLGAVGSAIGIASAIPGPQQPILQAAALVAGFVKGFLGDSKEDFDRKQTETLTARRYTGPETQTRTYDFSTGGDSVDYDWRGRSRVTPPRTVQVNVNVNAMDVDSFLRHQADIATAVGKALDAGHPLTESVNRLIFGTV